MNILIVTAHFPSYDCPGDSYATPFLFNYVEEWKRNGAEIHIIHLSREYPSTFYLIVNNLSHFGIESLKKYVVSSKARSEKEYIYKDVYIKRVTFKKYIPHGLTSRKEKHRLFYKLESMRQLFESADIIIGDCIDPSLDVIEHFKKSIRGTIAHTLHNVDNNSLQQKCNTEALHTVKLWLLRSKSQIEMLSNYIDKYEYTFMYSGIDKEYLIDNTAYRNEVKKLLYVGALYKSKGIDTTIEALSKLKSIGYQFSFTIVGDGVDREYFEKKTIELDVSDIVVFVGSVPHKEVFEYMRNADCFVMVSRETFGMVYIEAMSQGCIPIAAVGQGIDGVIIDHKNGFLTDIGDSQKLMNTLIELAKMDSEKVQLLSECAYKTVREMTNEILATNLMQKFINL